MRHGLHGPPTAKRPIAHRLFLLSLILFLHPQISFGTEATAQKLALLTEGDAVELGLSRTGLDEMLSAEIDIARSEVVGAGLYPNPVAGYTREQTFGGPAESAEDYASFLQKIDLSGRRGLRAEAARRSLGATRDEIESRRSGLAARIRLRFYDVLRRQRRVAAVRQWSERLGVVAERTARRAAAGDAAQYDRLRADRERAAAAARWSVEDAALARTRERLAASLSDEPPPPNAPTAVGDLMPTTPPPTLDAALERLPSRPDLRALESIAAAADLQARSSARWWLPEIEIGAGFKSVEADNERSNGFIASGAIPLPLLDRHQDEAMRAAAEAQRARGRRQMELAEAAGEVRGLHAQASRLAEAAQQARTEGDGQWHMLTRTAEAAYQGGETSILELVDAYRAQLDAELETLDLEWRARRARIELDRLTGEDSR